MQRSVFSYIKEHWIAYLIGAVLAIILGLGVSYYLGVKWSTPEEVRSDHIAARQQEQASLEVPEDEENPKE